MTVASVENEIAAVINLTKGADLPTRERLEEQRYARPIPGSATPA